jgi:hypothetical protein
MLRSHFARLGFMAIATALSFGGVARATFILDFNQVGGDVDAVGAGTIDINGLFLAAGQAGNAYIEPSTGLALVGNTNTQPGYYVYSASISPNTGFGSGGMTDATATAGDPAGIAAATNYIVVPAHYVSGTALADSATFAGQTFSSLGLTPGTYTYTFGPDSDSFIVNIGQGSPGVGSSPSVPEPAGIAAAGLALPALGLFACKRRKRMA